MPLASVGTGLDARVLEHRGLLEEMALRLCVSEAEAGALVAAVLEAARARVDPSSGAARVRSALVALLHEQFVGGCRRASGLPDGERPTSPPSWAGASAETLRRAVGQLEAGLRRTFQLHDLEGRSYDELARALRLPRAEVEAQVVRARTQLRALLERQLRVVA